MGYEDNGEREMELKYIDQVASEAVESGEIDIAIAGYLADAVAGDVAALFNLGVAYLPGDHLEKDQSKAGKLFQKAAAQDHQRASQFLEKPTGT